MVKQLPFAHSIPGHRKHIMAVGSHTMWMDIAMHDTGSLGHTLQIILPRYWENLALGCVEVLCS